MQNTSVVKNGILCLLALEKPVDFDNGLQVTLNKTNVSKLNSKENHHFFPYSLMQRFGTDNNGINSLLNFAFISARLNKVISNAPPSVYIANFDSNNGKVREFLKTHLLDEDAYNALKSDNFSLFIQKRGELILEKIKEKTKVGEFTEPEEQIMEENIEFEGSNAEDSSN